MNRLATKTMPHHCSDIPTLLRTHWHSCRRYTQSMAATHNANHPQTVVTAPMRKTTQLRNLLYSPKLTYIMEGHNAISSRIVEETGFKGIWGSGLSISASMGVRDSNEASWTQILDNLEFMADSTSIPILLDGDTGYGNFNNARRLVRKLEQRNIAGVCIEDKLFPKTNSFIDGPQELADMNEFCGKIAACKDIQEDPDFCVVARLESFISGRGLHDALERAYAYADAGADALLVHSKLSNHSEIEAFMQRWDQRKPIIIVPTKYWQTRTEEFARLGVSSIIWANHNIRSCVDAMRTTSQRIYHENSLANIETNIATVADIFALQNTNELRAAERKYLNYDSNGNGGSGGIVYPEGEKPPHSSQILLDPNVFFNTLTDNGVKQYFGVPDSLLKEFLAVVEWRSQSGQIVNTVTANEGTAVGMAAGYHLGTGEIPCVYLQNSGFGNLLNPVMSLLKMYDLPMLMVMGWRGQPNTKDEPQHFYQGQCTESLLNAADIKYSVLPTADANTIRSAVAQAMNYIITHRAPYFLLIRKDSFDQCPSKAKMVAQRTPNNELPMQRYTVLQRLAAFFNDDSDTFVSTTGYGSRELYDIREKDFNGDHSKDFYMVGAMGHCSSVALGVALNCGEKRVVCVDGDGGLLMHMGAIGTIGYTMPKRFIHILMNNGCHESVGKQKLNHNINYAKLVEACGYNRDNIYTVASEPELESFFADIKERESDLDSPVFVDMRVRPGTIDELGRPKKDFVEQKNLFMRNFI